jgi:hypothetical protein
MADSFDKESDRLRRFESVLAEEPMASAFAPKPHTAPTVATLVEQIRTHVSALNMLCDDIDAAITASEENARKAADNLIEAIKKIK